MDTWINWIDKPEAWIALGTLTVLEIVLGIDNVVFISILSGRLPEEQQAKARNIGLGLAMGGRIVLLLSLGWVMGLKADLFEVFGHGFSGRDLILLVGGLFLLGKATHEIHNKLEGEDSEAEADARPPKFRSVLIQILLLDMVFSLDSVITAVGMADYIAVMILAVVISVAVMMLTAAKVSAFIERHPTVKMLALSFLLLIGFTLMVEGLGAHMPKGYIYFAMGFSVLVEMLNLRMKSRAKPVDLREPRLQKAIERSSDT
jgi:predicted tellurium resistance membrane protein TerC